MCVKYIIFVVLCLFHYSNQGTTSRIIGGHEVEPHSIPYQAFLNITGTDNSTWVCGGSLVTPNYVLTAARCCVGARSMSVVLGAHDLTNKNIYQVTLESENFTINPKFTTNVYDLIYVEDIAVVALPQPVNTNNFVKTVRLPNPYDWTECFINRTGRVGGWGLTDGFNTTSYSPVLLALESRILSNHECQTSHYDLSNYDLCLEINQTTSPCIGDYGSPLVVDDIQVGIYSQGADNFGADFPYVFSRVSDFLTWIKEVTDYKDDDFYTTTQSTSTLTPPTTSKGATVTTASSSTDTTTIDTISTTTDKAFQMRSLTAMLLISVVVLVKHMLDHC